MKQPQLYFRFQKSDRPGIAIELRVALDPAELDSSDSFSSGVFETRIHKEDWILSHLQELTNLGAVPK
jgi:hypothetical protein